MTYKIKRPDFLVVTGETATGKSYIRYAAGPAGIRGFTLGYDKALGAEVDRLVIAIANSVVPFPDAAEAVPAQAARPAPRSGPLPTMPARAMPHPGQGAAPAAIGLIVAPGRVLTSAAALDSCAAPRVAGMAARVIRTDAARGLTLLEVAGLKGRAAAFAAGGSAPASGDAVVVLGAEAGGGVAVSSGEIGADGERVFAPLQPGSAGAVVLDRGGRLAGLVARYPASPRLVAGVAPPTSYALVGGRTVVDFLAETGVTSVISPVATPVTAGASLGAVAHGAIGAVVSLTCQP